MDYQALIDVIAEIMQYCLAPAITIGLCERLFNMVVKAATGRDL